MHVSSLLKNNWTDLADFVVVVVVFVIKRTRFVDFFGKFTEKVENLNITK